MAWAFAAYLLWQTRVPGGVDTSPDDPNAGLSPGRLDEAADFERFLRLDLVLSQVVLILVLLVYARYGVRFARESAAGRIGTGMLLAMLGLGLVWLAQLPFGLAAVWWERRHDVSELGYDDWMIGNWVALGSEFLFVCFAILVVMGLAGVLRNRWWIVGGPFFTGLAALFVFIYPFLVVDTHPLRDPGLAADARRLADQQDVEGIPIRVQEVREYTSAPNAEATGLGPTRRIFLWDTLLDGRFPRPEVRFVLAHELAHQSRHHLPKLIGWYALFAIPGAFLIAVATRRRGGMYHAQAVPLSLLVFVGLQLAGQPLQNVIGRHVEAEADWIALESTREPQAAESLFRRFGTTGLEQPSPPTWAYVFFSTHPTIAQRIEMAREWEERNR